MRTLNKIFKLDKEKFVVPKCSQDIIPIKALWEDGIFLIGNNKYSKSYKFIDINYAVAGQEEQENMFINYGTILNMLDKVDFPLTNAQVSDYLLNHDFGDYFNIIFTYDNNASYFRWRWSC